MPPMPICKPEWELIQKGQTQIKTGATSHITPTAVSRDVCRPEGGAPLSSLDNCYHKLHSRKTSGETDVLPIWVWWTLQVSDWLNDQCLV